MSTSRLVRIHKNTKLFSNDFFITICFHCCLPDCFSPPKLLLSARNCCFSLPETAAITVLPDCFNLPETATSVYQELLLITVLPDYFSLPETATSSPPETATILLLLDYNSKYS